jgi:hypothetical protein
MRRTVALLLAGLVLVPAASAAVSKQPVFGLRAVGANKRGYFVYAVPPGSAKHGSVIVTNVGTAAGTVRLFVADGDTGPTTGTVYKTDAPPTKTGTWVTLSATSFALAPGGHRKVPFAVRVPAGARAGQWVAGIVAETARQEATQRPGQKARVQIRIRDLTIVAVQVNVPGPPVVSFDIGDVTTGGTRGFQKVIVHIANSGNVLATPRGAVTIFDKSGRVVQVLPFKMDTFLPDTAIDYPVLLKKALPAGDYTASVRLTVPGLAGAGAKSFSAKPSFSVSDADVKQVFTSAAPQAAPAVASSGSTALPDWAIPVAVVVAALLVIVALLWWLLARRRRDDDEFERRPPTTYARSPSASAATETREPTEPAFLQFMPEPAAPPPAEAPTPPAAPQPPVAPSHEHYWEVGYDRGALGSDGVWRFPHRCRDCGLELLARDVGDASAQVAQSP